MNSYFDPKSYLLTGAPSTFLAECVCNALFNDRAANIGDRMGGGEIATSTSDRGGWWADPTFGSRLHLLMRSGKLLKNTPETCRQYILEALKPLQDSGILGEVEVAVTTTGEPKNGLAAEIKCHKPDGSAETLRFDDLWDYVR